MVQLKFPVIEGREFRQVPRHPAYAVDNTGQVWHCQRGKWYKMKSYTFCDGREAVMCNYTPRLGAGVVFPRELVETLFPCSPTSTTTTSSPGSSQN